MSHTDAQLSTARLGGQSECRRGRTPYPAIAISVPDVSHRHENTGHGLSLDENRARTFWPLQIAQLSEVVRLHVSELPWARGTAT